ncbi:MAG: T9SS type A sorting domain-containing protein [Ignavibacteria bacterium]|nr:T9SS type A sorting domain-containing protein [Ignavibacteria bacterium]
MKKIIFSILFLFIIQSVFSQPRYIMTFDGVNPGSLPGGWIAVNNSGFNIRQNAQWQVRDSGQYIYYMSPFTPTKSRSGNRAISVNYYAGMRDSIAGMWGAADAWLISPGLSTIAGDSLRFFATGCYDNNADSLQIWISTTNQSVSSFTKKLGTIKWQPGSPYGKFTRYAYSLSGSTPGTVFVGFRYYMNCSQGDGYMVQIDDFALGVNVAIENESAEIPKKFELTQNYPNPFNPNTTIRFDLPKKSSYVFSVYDLLGKKVYEETEANLSPGSYNINLNMSSFSSGVYFYTLRSGDFFERKQMVLVK